MKSRITLPVAALLLSLALPAPAQEATAPGPDGDRALAEADAALAEGRYGDAEGLFTRIVDGSDPPPAAALAGLAEVLSVTGRLPAALAAAERAAARDPGDGLALVRVGNLRFEIGDIDGAGEALGRAAELTPRSAVAREALGAWLRATGKREQAVARFREANDLWASRVADTTADHVAVVRARLAVLELDRRYAARLQSTLDILAGPMREGVPEAFILMADAHTRHSQTEKVPNTLRPVLERVPNHPDALVALARAKQVRFDAEEAASLARKALLVDPTHPGALEILAMQRLGDGDGKGAREVLAPGLAARPKHRALLALDAVPLLLAGDEKGYLAAVGKVLALDPTYGRAYDFAARALEDQRRFAEAAAMARRAVEVDETDADGWFSLARNLLNLGEEEEAKKALDRADREDRWHNLFRENFRTVLTELAGYASGSTEHFVIRIHREENAALRGLYEKALEDSWRVFVDRYGFTPETPVLAEVFRDAASFSARTLGIPGFSAVGACFGKVVTLDSPTAIPPGSFCWLSTAHHEMAHVFHLQMTRGRVPRWLTEGLAVHEERRAHPSWIRNMDRELVSALANGEVKGLLELDGTFRGPGVMWAYYQGGLVCDWLEREFGWDKVLEMLRLYGRDLGNAEVVKEALGLTPEEYDGRFLAYCRRKTEGWKVRPAWSDAKFEEFRLRSRKDEKDLEAHLLYGEACLQRGKPLDAGSALARARAVDPDNAHLTELRGLLSMAQSRNQDRGMDLLAEALAAGWDHFDLRMTLAGRAEKAGRIEEALEHYRQAKFLFPRAPGKTDPRLQIQRLLLAAGKPDEALRELEEHVALEESELEYRMVLASAYEERADAAAALRVLDEIVAICPVPGRDAKGQPSGFPAAEVHARRGRALSTLGRHGEAADAFALAVTVARVCRPQLPDDAVAGILVEQAKAARRAGRAFDARAAAEDAARTDPGNAEAAELLQELAR